MPHRRHVPIFAILGAMVLVTGCGDLLSLHALYTSQDRVLESALDGRWEDDDDPLTVQRAADGYNVILQSQKNPSESEKYQVRLVDIAGVRFADLLPEDQIGHMFLKVTVTGDQLRVAFFDSEWLRQRVRHEEADIENGRKRAVLTSPTSELRRVVAKYAAEPKAYDQGKYVPPRQMS